MSVNTRGLRDIVERKAFFLFWKVVKADLIFLTGSPFIHRRLKTVEEPVRQ